MKSFTDFIYCVIINMAFRSGFLLLALICFILHLLIPAVPLYITFLVLGVWLLYAILITAGISFVSRCNTVPRNQKGISLHPGRNAYFDKMYGVSNESAYADKDEKDEYDEDEYADKSQADEKNSDADQGTDTDNGTGTDRDTAG